MAGTNGRQAGGERVLESRHLVGLFLGVVLLCGVFFTLGYVMGKTQYGTTQVANAASLGSPAPKPQAATPAPASAGAHDAQPPEWDFGDKDKQPPHLDSSKSGAAISAGPPNSITPRRNDAVPSAGPKRVAVSAPPKESAGYQPPAMGKGAIVLQLAALKREGDAMALADALKQKSFPSFVVTSTADSLFRVQVGPYADLQAANVAKQSLAHEGFNSIIKR
ncbi:MAG: SPOR domain-containing protein [Candidatus Acidiferrales bacterium]